MSESIAEMVLPGTYIEVRAEGLISVGGITTGNIGIIGTASRGPVGKVIPLGSLAEAVAIFGQPDAFTSPRKAGAPLSLTRTLSQAYGSGAQNVFAIRIANGNPAAATLALKAAGDKAAFTLTARGIAGEDGAEIENSSGTWGQDIKVEIVADPTTDPASWRVVVAGGALREVYTGANVGDIHDKIASSKLVSVGNVSNGGDGFVPIGPTALTGGTDGADVNASHVGDALALLEPETINILLIAGLGANVVGTKVLGHLDRTEAEGRERIAVLGAQASGDANSAQKVLDDAAATSDDRIVLVAPGVADTETDPTDGQPLQVVLPPPYLAAAIAGKLSTLAPHISLTNKVLAVTPDVRYSTTLTQQLLQAHVLIVRQKVGNQVVKGITTSPPPFDQITIRRTVDYAKAGVRLGADPYIGRLNNARVRAALRATLDGFLSQMVLDEMLVSYDLAVSATRAQERAGICSVVMTLRPTFSIDFIRVTMNLE